MRLVGSSQTENGSWVRQEKASVTENKEIWLEITKENRKNRNNRLKTKELCDELCTGVWPAK